MARAHGEGSRQTATVTINILPDDVFREIFALCIPAPDTVEHMKEWQGLVHVCKRWREIIYASPRYLNLHLCYSNGTPFRNSLSCWPAVPISIAYHLPFPHEDDDDRVASELIAALERSDRVGRIDLDTMSGPGEVVAVMQVPFPVMTHLEISAIAGSPVLPSGFLGGSAPCLQHLHLFGISFPELPTLLLSAHDLVSLQLNSIGYISPRALVVGLASLTRLRTLRIETRPPIHPFEQTTRRLSPPTMTVLPALTQFVFGGESEYLEDLVAQIDTPRVEDVRIQYSVKEVRASQLSRFIDRTENLKLAQFKDGEVTFFYDSVSVELDEVEDEAEQEEDEAEEVEVEVEVERYLAHLSVTVETQGSDSQVLFMASLLGQLGATLSKVELLCVHWIPLQFGRQDDVDRTEWLELLRLFPAVETMCVYKAMAGYIACALEGIAEEVVTEVLPALHLLCLEDDGDDGDDDNHDSDGSESDNEYSSYFRYKKKSLGSTERFLSLRKLSGHPVTIVKSEDEFVERFIDYQGCKEIVL